MKERDPKVDIKKIIQRLPPGFVEETAAMDNDALQKVVVDSSATIERVDREMKSDEKLAGARAIVKDIVGAYNDAKKAQNAKRAYALHLLQERGAPIDDGET